MIFRKLQIFVLVAIALAMLSGCGKTNKVDKNAFITINDEICSIEEYRVYFNEAVRNFEEIGGTDIWETDFDGRSAVDVAKESALNGMIAVKVTAQRAGDFNIALTKEEEQQALVDAQSILASDGEEDIAYKKAVEKIMREKSLYTKVREYVVKDYVISEPEFDNYCDSYYDTTADQMKQLTVKALYFFEESTANEFYDRILDGENFENLFQEANETGENRIFLVKSKDLEGEMAELIDTEVGFVSRPVALSNVYGIFKVVHVEAGKRDEILAKLRQDYTSTMREQIFSNEMEKWISASTIKKDEKVWDEIDISR